MINAQFDPDSIHGRLTAFLDEWSIRHFEWRERIGFKRPITSHLGILHSKVYTRIVDVEDGDYKSVNAFVDMSTGDIYYPAGWCKPAKHVRGNLFSECGGLEALDGHHIRTLS